MEIALFYSKHYNSYDLSITYNYKNLITGEIRKNIDKLQAEQLRKLAIRESEDDYFIMYEFEPNIKMIYDKLKKRYELILENKNAMCFININNEKAEELKIMLMRHDKDENYVYYNKKLIN